MNNLTVVIEKSTYTAEATDSIIQNEGCVYVQSPKLRAMKVTFQSRLEAIDWIADHAEDEGKFEVLREQLLFNYLYHQTYFLELNETGEVILLDQSPQK